MAEVYQKKELLALMATGANKCEPILFQLPSPSQLIPLESVYRL